MFTLRCLRLLLQRTKGTAVDTTPIKSVKSTVFGGKEGNAAKPPWKSRKIANRTEPIATVRKVTYRPPYLYTYFFAYIPYKALRIEANSRIMEPTEYSDFTRAARL